MGWKDGERRRAKCGGAAGPYRRTDEEDCPVRWAVGVGVWVSIHGTIRRHPRQQQAVVCPSEQRNACLCALPLHKQGQDGDETSERERCRRRRRMLSHTHPQPNITRAVGPCAKQTPTVMPPISNSRGRASIRSSTRPSTTCSTCRSKQKLAASGLYAGRMYEPEHAQPTQWGHCFFCPGHTHDDVCVSSAF